MKDSSQLHKLTCIEQGVQIKKHKINKPVRNMIRRRLHTLQRNNLSAKISLKFVHSSNHLSSRFLQFKNTKNRIFNKN